MGGGVSTLGGKPAPPEPGAGTQGGSVRSPESSLEATSVADGLGAEELERCDEKAVI